MPVKRVESHLKNSSGKYWKNLIRSQVRTGIQWTWHEAFYKSCHTITCYVLRIIELPDYQG